MVCFLKINLKSLKINNAFVYFKLILNDSKKLIKINIFTDSFKRHIMFKINNKTIKYYFKWKKPSKVRLKHIHHAIKKCYSIFFYLFLYGKLLALHFFYILNI